MKYRLLTLLDDARGDIDAFRQGLEAWFDDTMARVSGWYKRKTQLILCLLAAIIAVAMNANTLTIGERLWEDPVVRSAVVQQAASPEVTGATAGRKPTERLNNAADDIDAVAKLGVPLGWSGNADDPRHVSFTSLEGVLRALVGWLLTFAAISLGAPFWFDALSRLSRLRTQRQARDPAPGNRPGPAQRARGDRDTTRERDGARPVSRLRQPLEPTAGGSPIGHDASHAARSQGGAGASTSLA